MRWASLVVCAGVCLASVAFAQDAPKAEVHGAYSYLNFDTNGFTSRQGANGWEGGASGNFNDWLGLEFSVAGYYKTYTSNVAVPTGVGPISASGTIKFRDYSYLAGPRFNFMPFFVHALFGGDHMAGGVYGSSPAPFGQRFSQGGWAGGLGGGIQRRIAGPMALRLSADYIFSQHKIFSDSASRQNNFRVAVGIAYTFARGSREEALPSMAIPALGVTVIATKENRGTLTIDVGPGSVADSAGLHRLDIITSVGGKQVHTPAELATVLSGASGNVKIGYVFRTQTGSGIEKETTVALRRGE